MTKQEHRQIIEAQLAEISTDIKHILKRIDATDKYINHINSRVRILEKSVNTIKGIGTILSMLFVGTLSWVGVKLGVDSKP